jgi:two-component system response regulator (stage 0 sporulation protein A)
MPHTRVLVADDNRAFGTILSRFIGAQPDMDVVGLATSGAEVLRMAASLQPDVVLMDLYMPETDGFEATRRISGSDSRVKVIALTAHGSADNERLSFDAGASAFVRKSDVDVQLLDRIRSLAMPACSASENGSPDSNSLGS